MFHRFSRGKSTRGEEYNEGHDSLPSLDPGTQSSPTIRFYLERKKFSLCYFLLPSSLMHRPPLCFSHLVQVKLESFLLQNYAIWIFYCHCFHTTLDPTTTLCILQGDLCTLAQQATMVSAHSGHLLGPPCIALEHHLLMRPAF